MNAFVERLYYKRLISVNFDEDRLRLFRVEVANEALRTILTVFLETLLGFIEGDGVKFEFDARISERVHLCKIEERPVIFDEVLFVPKVDKALTNRIFYFRAAEFRNLRLRVLEYFGGKPLHSLLL